MGFIFILFAALVTVSLQNISSSRRFHGSETEKNELECFKTVFTNPDARPLDTASTCKTRSGYCYSVAARQVPIFGVPVGAVEYGCADFYLKECLEIGDGCKKINGAQFCCCTTNKCIP